AVALQTFLHTGLFITAHDAMHGSVARGHPQVNRLVGRLTTLLYALFSYEQLQAKHADHHATPVTDTDPDYHNGDHERFWPWYLGFLREYVGFWQIVGMAAVYNLLHHGLGVELAALNLFWVVPSLLSTLQLFYFGTYLPHRHPGEGFVDDHRATSNDFSPTVSFLTCYHFGYHHEHHSHPGVPWWRLPSVRAGGNAHSPPTSTL
ncbi:MAG: fatty acid desaturase, partial [Bradymonadaceae bacterium]